jgi:hypothetical protein
MKKRKKIYERTRVAFRLMLQKEVYDEIKKRSRERFQPMTGYITKAILDRILRENHYE